MGSKRVRFSLFLSSYAPLFVIFFLLFVDDHPLIATGVLLMGVVGVLIMLLYLYEVNLLEPTQVEIEDVRRRGAEVAGYLVAYLVPFLKIPFDGVKQAIALLIFFFILGVLYVSSNMLYYNPVLSLIGFRLYEVKLREGGSHFLITRRPVVRGQSLPAIKVGEDIIVEKRK